MTLTVAKLDKFISHFLDGEQGSPISSREIVNQVGEWFVTENQWGFNLRRTKLTVRQKLDFSGSYNAETLILRKAALFKDYEHTPGDYIALEAFASLPNTTPDEYRIRRRVDADTVELESKIHRNMIEWTEDYDDVVNSAYFTEINGPITYVTDTSGTTDPIGGSNAEEIDANNGGGVASIGRAFTTTSTPEKVTDKKAYCFSIHTKQIPADTQGMQIAIAHTGGSKSVSLVFNTTNGAANAPTVAGGPSFATGFETLANGWYRPWITILFDALDSLTLTVTITPKSSAGGIGGHYFWGTSFEEVADFNVGPSRYERRDDDTGVWTPATLAGLIPNNVIELPADLADVTAIASNTDTLDHFTWSGQQEMAELRNNTRFFENFGLRGAIVGYEPTDGGELKYRLELDREQSTSVDKLEMRYIAGWKRVTLDDERLPLPADGWLDALFTQAVMAWAGGLDEEDDEPLHSRLHRLTDSKMWTRAVGRDAGMQRDMGPSRGSDIRPRHTSGRGVFYDISTVAD